MSQKESIAVALAEVPSSKGFEWFWPRVALTSLFIKGFEEDWYGVKTGSPQGCLEIVCALH